MVEAPLPLARDEGRGLALVALDCDGVLVEAHSSWRVLHEHFGTDTGDMLQRFIDGEVSDAQFMAHDIQLWKAVRSPIHRDELFRAYAGQRFIPGARQLVKVLRDLGVRVVIVSAGVDLFVSTIAAAVGADAWYANGFHYDDEGHLADDGVVAVPAKDKGRIIRQEMVALECPPESVVSVGDSEMDLSMHLPGTRFIGFCPSRPSSSAAFEAAAVPVVTTFDLRHILPTLLGDEGERLLQRLAADSDG